MAKKEAPENPRMPTWANVTFRDWVAAEALKGFVIKHGVVSPAGSNISVDPARQLAKAAYWYADALLEERAFLAMKEPK